MGRWLSRYDGSSAVSIVHDDPGTIGDRSVEHIDDPIGLGISGTHSTCSSISLSCIFYSVTTQV